MSFLEPIKLPKEIIADNQSLFEKLMQSSISDLKNLKKVNLKIQKRINQQITLKVHHDSLDEIDRSEINKSKEKLRIERILIEEAIEKKYLNMFS